MLHKKGCDRNSAQHRKAATLWPEIWSCVACAIPCDKSREQRYVIMAAVCSIAATQLKLCLIKMPPPPHPDQVD